MKQMARDWRIDQIEAAKAELRRRYPEISGATFRVLVATAADQVTPEVGVPGLVDCAEQVMQALTGTAK
jgi:hypothetical protein